MLHIADIASYQGSLSLAELRAAGFDGINVKISHGTSLRSVHLEAERYVRDARAAGMKLSCFHWLTGGVSGLSQADYAYRSMALFGLNVPGVVHVVDVEEAGVSEGIYRDYCRRMTQLLDRSIVTYSADWYVATALWLRASEESPWLWAAPNIGYQRTYPGDASDLWDAGYGDWERLAVMQYRVAPVAGIQVSQSAAREALWRVMAGEATVAVNSLPASTALLNEFNALAPNRSRSSDGTIGDLAHSQSVSDHNLDESGNTGGVADIDTIDEVHARDVSAKGPWPDGWTMERCVQLILSRCRSGQEKRLRYIIYNYRIWRRSAGWKQEAYNRPNPHTQHAHFSFMYGSGSGLSNPENITSPYGLLAAFEAEQEDDMDQKQFTTFLLAALKDKDVKAALEGAAGRGVHNQKLGKSQETIGMDLQSDDNATLVTAIATLDVRLANIEELLSPTPPPSDA